MTNHNNNPETPLEAAITRSLEQAAPVVIPADFAARVVASLPPQRAPRRISHMGYFAAMAAVVILTLALFVLAPHVAPRLTSFSFSMELLMLLELGGTAYWLTARRPH